MGQAGAIRVSGDEDVSRLISSEWLVNGILQPTAFTLNYGESYLSVNRPIVDTYDSDVSSFLTHHPTFRIENGTCYCCAMLNVREIEEFDMEVGDGRMIINVEVELRDSHTKSHAGIFTRHMGKNIKRGQHISSSSAVRDVSADDILLEVRTYLMNIAMLMKCAIPPSGE